MKYQKHIGELIRNGNKVYYAVAGGKVFESPNRDEVVSFLNTVGVLDIYERILQHTNKEK